MKYAILILGGGADRPSSALDALTPLSASNKPTMDRVSTRGRQGTARTIPPGISAGSSAGLATLLGCTAVPSDGQLRAHAAGIELAPDDLALRLDLVCVTGDEDDRPSRMLAHEPAQLTTAESRLLLTDLQEYWRANLPEREQMLSRLAVHVGSRGAHLLVDRGGAIAKALGDEPLRCAEPETILAQAWQEAAPIGAAGELVAELMEASHRCFADHEVNRTRIENGLLPVSMVWISGAPVTGPIHLPRFEDLFTLRGALVSRTPGAIGLAGALGIDRISLPDADTAHDRTATLGEYARSALDRYDLVIVETGLAAEAALAGDAHAKIEAIELIDRNILMPLLARLEEEGDNEKDADQPGYRCMITCDRTIATDDRATVDDPVPFAMCGSWVRSVVQGPFTEAEAHEADLHVESASDLMEYFLFSGLKRPRSTRRPPRSPRPPQSTHPSRSATAQDS